MVIEERNIYYVTLDDLIEGFKNGDLKGYKLEFIRDYEFFMPGLKTPKKLRQDEVTTNRLIDASLLDCNGGKRLIEEAFKRLGIPATIKNSLT